MNKTDELKFIIGRYDHYYDSINNKGNLYLTINTFILGGSIAGFASLNPTYHFDNWIIFIFIATLLSNVISFLYTLSAIKPFTQKHGPPQDDALMFFGDVSALSVPQWKRNWANVDDSKWLDELQNQSHHLAKGLQKKFFRLRRATMFIGLQIILTIVFGIIFLTQ